MAVCYNNLWKLLIDRNMNKTELKEAAGVSFNVMARMGKNETVVLIVFILVGYIMQSGGFNANAFGPYAGF